MNKVGAQRYGLPLALFFASFLSFQFNLFRVTPQSEFERFDAFSPALVLDGIVHHRFVPYSGLGMYRRGTLDPGAYLDDQANIDKLEDNREFFPYNSQFGLQYYVFDFLYTTFKLSVPQLEATASLLMALVVAGFFIALRRILPTAPALGFCLTLVLSPWVVCFANNLFWVEATWFLPCLVSLFLGNRRPTTASNMVLACLLFLSMLIKCLCGYDFITCVFFAALAPLVLFQAKYNVRAKDAFRQLAVAGGAMIIAFACALGLHLALLSNHASLLRDNSDASSVKVADTPRSGVAVIVLTAEKRFYSKDPDKTAREVCAQDKLVMSNPEDCIRTYKGSLQSSVFNVVAQYFVFPRLIPWIPQGELDGSERAVLNNALSSIRKWRFAEALRLIRSLHESSLGYCFLHSLSVVLFLTLIALVGRVIYRRKRRWDLAWVGVAFFAPISWYAGAKGYSYIHTQLCFVLWFLPFVPASIALLLFEYSRSNGPKSLLRR